MPFYLSLQSLVKQAGVCAAWAQTARMLARVKCREISVTLRWRFFAAARLRRATR
jgi:hypothetical protein